MSKFLKLLTISLASFTIMSTTTFATTISPKNGLKAQNSTDPKFWAEMQTKDTKAKLYSDFKDGKIDKNTYLKQSENLKIDNSEREFIKKSKTNAELQKESKTIVLTKDMKNKLNNTFDTITSREIVSDETASSSGNGMIWDLYQQPQQTSYYCGPATVASILGAKNLHYSQSDLASYLGTTTAGTAWYNGGNSYPVRDVLNSLENTFYYAVYPASTNSTSQLSYKVKYSIDRDYGVAANIYEVYNGTYSLPGHSGRTIEHWIPIDGYYNNGSSIHYAEPIYNATSISWYKNVTSAYSTVPDYVMSYVIWEKGLVW